VSVVMGLDQHRAQIAAEWIDTVTGEVSRARIVPADRTGVREFLARFRGEALEVGLEATTGWRFVVEELEQIGAEVHLAEPAEAAALKGKKKRAKTDWADARHLRELLLIGRLPESWIPPAHILDLRAQVRTRHLLSHQRTEGQQRMHSVLYHHGCPQRRNLFSLESRKWIAGVMLPAAAKDRRRCAGRSMRQPNAPASQPAPTAPITNNWPRGSAATAPASRSRASCSNAATTSSKTSATTRSRPSPDPLSRGKPKINR
jgi:Transposase